MQRVADWRYSTFHRYVRQGLYTVDWGQHYMPQMAAMDGNEATYQRGSPTAATHAKRLPFDLGFVPTSPDLILRDPDYGVGAYLIFPF